MIGCPVYNFFIPENFYLFIRLIIRCVEPWSGECWTWLCILEYYVGVYIKEQTAPLVKPANIKQMALGGFLWSYSIHSLYLINDL